jgi:hypothetical protein
MEKQVINIATISWLVFIQANFVGNKNPKIDKLLIYTKIMTIYVALNALKDNQKSEFDSKV